MGDLESIQKLAKAFVDPYFIITPELKIIDCNLPFIELWPKEIEGSVQGKKCCDILKFNICNEQCRIKSIFPKGAEILNEPVEIFFLPQQSSQALLTAIPLLEAETISFVFITLRLIPDKILESILEKDAVLKLNKQLVELNKEYLRVTDEVVRLHQELVRHKKGLIS